MSEEEYTTFKRKLDSIFSTALGAQKAKSIQPSNFLAHLNDICSLKYLREVANRKTMQMIKNIWRLMPKANVAKAQIQRLLLAVSRVVDIRTGVPRHGEVYKIKSLFQGKQSLQNEIPRYISSIASAIVTLYPLSKISGSQPSKYCHV